MNSRVKELDFLKCIFIILMIIFHLVYIGDSYPYAKQVVYTFHMSAFLVISGYLNNVNKKIKAFGRSLLWIFIPYVCMETGYVIMSAILPVREKITELSAGLLLHKAIIAPMPKLPSAVPKNTGVISPARNSSLSNSLDAPFTSSSSSRSCCARSSPTAASRSGLFSPLTMRTS